MPVPDPPDLAALARGPSPSTPIRPQSPWTHIRQLALRGGLRDTKRHFTPPKPCARWRPGLGYSSWYFIVLGYFVCHYYRTVASGGHNRFKASPVKDQFGLVCGLRSTFC
ncbi:hypothetical protein EDB89DRAFT_1908773 [Lactarius sanguifluus]|nr:hypothetical protein EDB89DRAFT_1908773 [Lactarius sanguifluus]